MIMVIHFLQRKHIVPNLQVATVLTCGHEGCPCAAAHTVTADMTAPHRCTASHRTGVPLVRVHGP
jgi:hypothetical protein